MKNCVSFVRSLATRLALILCFSVLGLAHAGAATVTVTSTSDSGAGSLRQAIAAALAGDTIRFAVPTGSTIKLTTGQISIPKDLTIAGPGVDRLTVSGSNLSRIFFLPVGVTVNLSGLTIADGASGADSGGAIFCEVATLDLHDVVLARSKAATGGALGFDFSTVYMTDCTLSGNSAAVSGGAIYCNEGSVLLTGCALYWNSAGSVGGGIHNLNGTVNLTNCTMAQNGATRGGAIYNERGTVFSNHVTISKNNANAQTGGIYDSQGATTYLANTIVAANTAPANPDLTGDEFSQQDSLGGSLIGIGTGSKINLFGTADQCGTTAVPVDPKLGPIQDNGGPTWTMALLPGSLALNHGVNALAVDSQMGSPLATDQRGFPRIGQGRVDSGAYEFFTARGYKREAYALTAGVTGDATTDCRLSTARWYIAASLNDCYWVDDGHLTCRGLTVFCNESQAACHLTKIVATGGPWANRARTILDLLAEADAALAQTAINEAAATQTCHAARLATARTQLGNAGWFRSQERITDAISTYGQAWKYARWSTSWAGK